MKRNETPNHWISFLALLKREVYRYIKYPTITLAPPLISQFLYIIIFGIVLGGRIDTVYNYPYIAFMFPGLIMMVVLMNSFINPSWSMFSSRHFGWIESILASPLSHTQIAGAYITAGVIRGLLVGVILLGFGILIPGVTVFTYFLPIIGFLIVVSFLSASLGCIIGLWAEKFDHISLILNFALFPLVFLGGVFYSLEMVEGIPILESFVRYNPVTHMINGLRYGMIGITELRITPGFIGLIILSILLFMATVKLVHDGYNLRY